MSAALTMTDAVTAETMKAGLLRFADLLLEYQQQLTELDLIGGDGDHGTTMANGARAMLVRLHAVHIDAESSPATLLRQAGSDFLSLDGGAAGPLFGCMLRGMAKAAPPVPELQPLQVAACFRGGLTELHSKTQARVGDKTMLDALTPAVEAAEAAAQQNVSASALLHSAAQAAQQGAAATSLLIARFGRARNLGERTLHHADPGATSLSLFFRALADVHSQSPAKDTDHAGR